jgi:hypothetical protein
MKRGWIFLILIIIQISIIGADSFTIIWGSSSGGELTIGGTSISVGFGTTPSTPSPPTTPTTPSGGGGTVTMQEGFSSNKNLLVVAVKKGVQKQESVTIVNNEATNLEISISISNLSEFIFPAEKNFILKPKESKVVIFNIYVPESETRNVITGKIDFISKTLTKSTNVVLDITEKAPLFDIKTELIRNILVPGQRAIANVKILNLGDLKNIDVELETLILDRENNLYESKKETFAIEDSTEKQVFIRLPKNIELGNYSLSNKVSYKNISAKSYDSFRIIKSVIDLDVVAFWIVFTIILTLIMLILMVLINRIKKQEA